MSEFGSKLRRLEGGMVMFHCPGCRTGHQVGVDGEARPKWFFNENGDAPTFLPSVLVTRKTWVPAVTGKNLAEYKANPWPQSEVTEICHSFVTDGKIQFLSDSTHDLAGQTVDLPDWTSITEGD